MAAAKIAILLIGSGIILWMSRRNLKNPRQHGFFRFLAWQTILIAWVVNLSFWFFDPFSWRQIISWILLIVSLVLIFLGVRSFNQQGGVDPQRIAPGLVGIEKTTQLVTTGIYRYIRHPFYASLLFLSWGIFFKHITLPSLSLSLLATIFLFICAWIEEGENEAYFGQAYRQYMKQTKMFIPFVV